MLKSLTRFSDELGRLHSRFNQLAVRRLELEQHLQREFGAYSSVPCARSVFIRGADAPSLTLRSSMIQGMHVHIARAKRDSAKIRQASAFVLISENNSTSSFFYPVISTLPHSVR